MYVAWGTLPQIGQFRYSLRGILHLRMAVKVSKGIFVKLRGSVEGGCWSVEEVGRWSPFRPPDRAHVDERLSAYDGGQVAVLFHRFSPGHPFPEEGCVWSTITFSPVANYHRRTRRGSTDLFTRSTAQREYRKHVQGRAPRIGHIGCIEVLYLEPKRTGSQ